MLKTVPPRVIPQNPATSGYAPTPATSRYIPTHATSGCWSGGNCRQGASRAEDLHVARRMTGRSRNEAGLLTRRRRSTRCGGDRHRSNRGCQQRYVVVHPRSHDHRLADLAGISRQAPRTSNSASSPRPGCGLVGPTAGHQRPVTRSFRAGHTSCSLRRAGTARLDLPRRVPRAAAGTTAARCGLASTVAQATSSCTTTASGPSSSGNGHARWTASPPRSGPAARRDRCVKPWATVSDVATVP